MMKLEILNRRDGSESNKKLTKRYSRMQNLLTALEIMELPSNEITSINERIQLINSLDGTDKELIKILRKTYKNILTLLEEKLGLVTKHHFRALWMVYGMLAATVLSTVFSISEIMGIGSSAGLWLSIGMFAGIIAGNYFDDQAEKNGKQIGIVVSGF